MYYALSNSQNVVVHIQNMHIYYKYVYKYTNTVNYMGYTLNKVI